MSEADFTHQIEEQLKIEALDKVTVPSVVPEPKLTPAITVAVSLTVVLMLLSVQMCFSAVPWPLRFFCVSEP